MTTDGHEIKFPAAEGAAYLTDVADELESIYRAIKDAQARLDQAHAPTTSRLFELVAARISGVADLIGDQKDKAVVDDDEYRQYVEQQD